MKKARLRTSALLFLAYSAFGGFNAFLNLFYREQGMNLIQVGMLASIPAGMTLFAAPLWAGIADRFNLHRFVLPLTMVLSIPFALLLGKMHTFGKLMMGICLFASCYSAIVPLSDNAVLVNLGGEQKEYGRIRLWGSMGVGIMAWVNGILARGRSLSLIFTVYAFFMAMAAVVAVNLPKAPQVKVESYWHSARQFLRNPHWRKFLFGCLLSGLSHLLLSYYLFIFARSLGAPDDMLGYLVTVAAATNIIVYIIMPHMLKRWTTRQVLIFSNGLLALRCTLTVFVQVPGWIFLTQLLDGPTWGTMWAAGVQHASEIAPRGLGASAQAIYNAIFIGLGGILAASLGGTIYSTWGASTLFAVAALMATLSLLVFRQASSPASIEKHKVLQEQEG